MERAAVVVRFIDAAVVNAVGISPNERVIAIVDHRDGKAAGKMSNAGEHPFTAEAVGMEDAIEWQLIFITQNKIMLHIKRGQSITKCGMEWIDFLADVGRLVHGFAISICSKKFQPPTGMARAELERSVICMANVRLERIAAEIRSKRAASTVHDSAGDWIVHTVFSPPAPQVGVPGCTSLV